MPYYNQGKNPWDRYGNPTECAICYSINHLEQICSDNKNENTFIVNEEVLCQSDFDNPNELKNLTSETWSSVLSDCGAIKTMCRKNSLLNTLTTLVTKIKEKSSLGRPITYTDSGTVKRSIQYNTLKSLPSLEATNFI